MTSENQTTAFSALEIGGKYKISGGLKAAYRTEVLYTALFEKIDA